VSLLYPRTKQIIVITSLTEYLNNDDSKGKINSSPPGVITKSVMKISFSDTGSELNSRERASSSIFLYFQIVIYFCNNIF
jgi:hypothetical protein